MIWVEKSPFEACGDDVCGWGHNWQPISPPPTMEQLLQSCAILDFVTPRLQHLPRLALEPVRHVMPWFVELHPARARHLDRDKEVETWNS